MKRLPLAVVFVSAVACLQLGLVESPAPAGRFQLRNDVALDVSTQLSWTRDAALADSAEAGRGFCDELVLQGLADWRVPSAKELATLLNWRTDLETGLDKRVFRVKDGSAFWTSTTLEAGPLVIDFQANARTIRVGAAGRVFCVRGP